MEGDVRGVDVADGGDGERGSLKKSSTVAGLVRWAFGAAPKKRENGLCVAVYKWSSSGALGKPKQDLIWWSGVFVSVVQLVVASLPWILDANWAIFLITSAGTILSYASAKVCECENAQKQHKVARMRAEANARAASAAVGALGVNLTEALDQSLRVAAGAEKARVWAEQAVKAATYGEMVAARKVAGFVATEAGAAEVAVEGGRKALNAARGVLLGWLQEK